MALSRLLIEAAGKIFWKESAMRAIILREIGSPDNWRIEEVADPRPGPGEVIVALRAAALNHRDLFILQGLYPGITLPAIPGSDGAGRVTEIGAGVDPSWLDREVVIEPGLDWGGDELAQSSRYRILGMPDDGTFAELIRIPVSSLQPTPEHLTPEEAAALPLAGLTAYRAVVTRARVKPGEKVMITGIGGGVATLALQIARHLGAEVFVTSGSQEKIERAVAIGASAGVSYHDKDWGRRIVELTGGGPHVVIDSAGGESLETAVRVVRPAGRVVFFGATTGLAHKLDLYRAFFKQIDLLGSTMGSPREFAALVGLCRESGFHPPVDQVFQLSDAPAAGHHLLSVAQFGKVVLRIS
jgi:zinc-binding alcohol dehydrogenase/oxidoreductase